jgi:ligand-binding sensor domain-containing protein
LKGIWLHIGFLLATSKALAQSFPEPTFLRLTEKDGLSANHVNSVVQDNDGIIWIGTASGLNRFDGYSVKRFFADANEPTTLPNNFISSMVPDKKNNLWISTSEGICYFNTRTQRSVNFQTRPGDSSSFRNQYRPFIYLDSTQLPWITTHDGLYHFSDSLNYRRMEEGISEVLPQLPMKSYIFAALVEDMKGQMWTAWSDVIFKLDPQTKKAVKAYICPDSILIRHIQFDSRNRCWVSTWGNGIYLFAPDQNSWKQLPASKIFPIVLGSAEWDLNGRKFLVFTHQPSGLLFVDESNLKTYSHEFEPSLSPILGLPLVDRQDILWVPTADGLYYSVPSGNLFSVLPVISHPEAGGKPISGFVYNMKEEPSGYWLSKREGAGGVLWYSREWKLIRSWLRLPFPRYSWRTELSASGKEAFDVEQLDQDIFITTEGGIAVLHLPTLQWAEYGPPDLGVLPRLRTIVPENDHKWWIRSYDHGVYVFDPIRRSFTKRYSNDSTGENCLAGNVNYLLRDKKGRVFATTDLGLFTYDPLKDDFTRIRFRESSQLSHALMGMVEDDGGLLWIGAENGLFAIDPDRGKLVKSFQENNQIGGVFRLCSDRDQNIWFGSTAGYWCWLRKTDRIIHFDYSLGLPAYSECIFYRPSNGLVYGGGRDAMVQFQPDWLSHFSVSANTKITEVMVNDSLAPFTENDGGRKKLVLSPEDNSIQVNFDVINYELVGKNLYYYKLSPGNRGWKQSENGHLSFYNLQPGNYLLEVRGSSTVTGTYTNIDSLEIQVIPYWYQSAWFKIAALLLAGALVFGIVRYRFRLVKREAVFNQKIAEMEMTALRAQMNPHFVFNSLNSIENFIMQNDKRQASDYMNKFARLIRMILENSRKEAVPLAKDMEAMQLYIDLEKLRFNYKFEYITDIDQALLDGDYRVAPLLIQPFVENAIVHGLAPCERSGLYLSISIKLHEDRICYTIEDNGIGRSESMTYREKRRTGHRSLGLEITRERIKILNKQRRSDSTLQIVDLNDHARKPAGTRVILSIKTA